MNTTVLIKKNISWLQSYKPVNQSRQ